MSIQRVILLTAGPVALVALCYWLTSEVGRPAPAVAETGASESTDVAVRHFEDSANGLQIQCEREAANLRPRIDATCRISIQSPFVLAGDLSETELDTHYRETIVPTWHALSTCYFDREPDQPIVVMLFSGEESYRRHAQRLDRRGQAPDYGYFVKAERRMVLNIATGGGTLAHELTHALAHFDFADMPEWFDEGLASLHEESQFSDDGLVLKGVSNWRIQHLHEAVQQGRLRALDAFISSRTLREDDQAVDYAHTRYFCLYLQERGLLSHFYRKFRSNRDHDLTGLLTLRQLFHAASLDEIDADFREWVQSR